MVDVECADASYLERAGGYLSSLLLPREEEEEEEEEGEDGEIELPADGADDDQEDEEGGGGGEVDYEGEEGDDDDDTDSDSDSDSYESSSSPSPSRSSSSSSSSLDDADDDGDRAKIIERTRAISKSISATDFGELMRPTKLSNATMTKISPPPTSIDAKGVGAAAAAAPFSVLIVEDTDICEYNIISFPVPPTNHHHPPLSLSLSLYLYSPLFFCSSFFFPLSLSFVSISLSRK
jgi:hypothetical protein